MLRHRDRRRDAVQAAKDAPPLRGRPESTRGCVKQFVRAPSPAFTPFLATGTLRTITATSKPEERP